jgi:comEA protein
MHINRFLFYWSQYLGADPKEITLISSLLVTVSMVGFFQIVSLRATSTATPSYDEQYQEFVERSQAFEQSYEQIIGSTSDSVSTRSNTLGSDSGDTLTINMNTATLKEWVQLPGIGEVYAQRILEYRSIHGDFTRLEDLMEVKGIGQKRWEKLKMHLYIEPSME